MTTQTAIIEGDLVVGRMLGIDGGPQIPRAFSELSDHALRFTGSAVIDVRQNVSWYVDHLGIKHLAPAEGRGFVTCPWDAKLVKTDTGWRVATSADALAPAIRAECRRRILTIASAETQMNMTAEAAAGRFSDAELVTYKAALDWVGDMRAKCAELIQGAVEDYASAAHWPPVPAGVVALCDRF